MAKHIKTIDCEFGDCDFVTAGQGPSMKKAHEMALESINDHVRAKHTPEGRIAEAKQQHETAQFVLKMRVDEFRTVHKSVVTTIERCAESIRASLAVRDQRPIDAQETYSRVAEYAQRDLLWMVPNSHVYDLPRAARAVEEAERFVKATAETLRLAEELVAEKVSA